MATLIGAAPSKAGATEACRAKQRCVRETLLGGDIACVWWDKQVMTVVKKTRRDLQGKGATWNKEHQSTLTAALLSNTLCSGKLMYKLHYLICL